MVDEALWVNNLGFVGFSPRMLVLNIPRRVA